MKEKKTKNKKLPVKKATLYYLLHYLMLILLVAMIVLDLGYNLTFPEFSKF